MTQPIAHLTEQGFQPFCHSGLVVKMAFLRRFAKLYLENQIHQGFQHPAVVTAPSGVAPLKQELYIELVIKLCCHRTFGCGSFEAALADLSADCLVMICGCHRTFGCGSFEAALARVAYSPLLLLGCHRTFGCGSFEAVIDWMNSRMRSLSPHLRVWLL